LGRVAPSLPISPKGLKGRIGHFRIERHDNNTGVLQHLVKFIGRVVAVARS
jgi:hypothetical protein